MSFTPMSRARRTSARCLAKLPERRRSEEARLRGEVLDQCQAGIEGSADGEAFLLYVEHFLSPSLKRSQRIMVMDNLQVPNCEG